MKIEINQISSLETVITSCNSAATGEYFHVSQTLIHTIKCDGREMKRFTLQNGISYRANDYNAPSNKFQIGETDDLSEAFKNCWQAEWEEGGEEAQVSLKTLIEWGYLPENATIKDGYALYLAICEAENDALHTLKQEYFIDEDDTQLKPEYEHLVK